MIKQIYLDYAAATPVDKRVVAAMEPYFSKLFFNPSAPYLPATEIKQSYQAAKATIAQYIGAKSDQLVMTSGATESINLAFFQADNVLISALEHPAVQAVAKSKAFFDVAAINSQGIVDLADLESKITPATELISVALVSSDLGTIQPIAKIAELIKKQRWQRHLDNNKTPLWLHCDASQALGYLTINASRLGVDFLTLSAAKIYGPKQVGCLWVRPGIAIKPLILGGGQEMGLRGGTENVPFVIGFAKAVSLLKKIKPKEILKLRNQLESNLLTALSDIEVLGSIKKRLPNYLVLTFCNIDAERLIYRLEDRGVLVSTGAACAANYQTGSATLRALGIEEAMQTASLRFTLGKDTTAECIESASKIIIEEIQQERQRLKK